MKTLIFRRALIPIALLTLLSIRCSYDNAGFDVTSIDLRNAMNVPMGSTGDISNQWKQQKFSAAELALFSGLDTANLVGTIAPIVSIQSSAYPNPFKYFTTIRAPFQTSNEVVAKYVIVNSFMSPVERNAIRLTSVNQLRIGSTIPGGRYRVYVIFTAQDNENFFTCWGNIWKN